MSNLRSELLFAGPVARIGNVVCCAPRSAPAAPEWVPDTRIVLPRRGVFALHRHGQGVVADGTSAVVLGAGEEYRVSHPADGGDECTVLVVPPELHEEAFGDLAGRQGTVRPSTQLRAQVLTSLAPGLESDERALLLLDAVATDLGAVAPPLERIAGGETNLARLAAELGFAHHSHFTARFRSVFHTTPSEVRRIVTAGGRRRA